MDFLILINLLTELNIDFVPEQIFEWSEHRLYDFYLPQYDCIIEAHGMQHYRDGYFTDFEDVHKNDIYKRKLALDNGIKKYIVVDCRFSKPDFIFQSICKSDLKDFIDITKIDINKIDLLCQKNILSYVVELYEKNYNTHQIEKMTKLSKSQICRLLNKANDLELIQYNKYKFKQEATKKAQITLYQNNAKPIKCLENGYVFGTCTIAAQNSEQI